MLIKILALVCLTTTLSAMAQTDPTALPDLVNVTVGPLESMEGFALENVGGRRRWDCQVLTGSIVSENEQRAGLPDHFRSILPRYELAQGDRIQNPASVQSSDGRIRLDATPKGLGGARIRARIRFGRSSSP